MSAFSTKLDLVRQAEIRSGSTFISEGSISINENLIVSNVPIETTGGTIGHVLTFDGTKISLSASTGGSPITVLQTTGTSTAATISQSGITQALQSISAFTTDATTLSGQSPSFYLDRANHTNTQLSNTISDFSASTSGVVNSYIVQSTGTSLTNLMSQSAITQALQSISGGSAVTALSALTDVSFTTPASGNIIQYNGTNWVNINAAGGFLPSATTIGSALRWNGISWSEDSNVLLGTTSALSVNGSFLAGSTIPNIDENTVIELFSGENSNLGIGGGSATVGFQARYRPDINTPIDEQYINIIQTGGAGLSFGSYRQTLLGVNNGLYTCSLTFNNFSFSNQIQIGAFTTATGSTPANGMLRYESNLFQGYQAGAWRNLVTEVSQSTGTSTALTMSQSAITAAIQSISGSTDALTLSGQSPSFYLNRANHTGTQLSNTISDFSASTSGVVNSYIVQTTGTSLTNLMSQSAITSAINTRAASAHTHTSSQITDFSASTSGVVNSYIVQSTGTSLTNLMSQNAVSTAIDTAVSDAFEQVIPLPYAFNVYLFSNFT